MDWTKLAAWLYENDPLPATIDPRIRCVYIDPRSDNAAVVIAAIRARSLVPGIYYDPHWYDEPTIRAHAQRVSDYIQVQKLLVPGEPVMLDLEELPQAWLAEMVMDVRSYLPSRPLAVTVGPGQDASIIPVPTFAARSVHLYIQLYEGADMLPAAASKVWPTNANLVAAGYPASMLHPFYDGKMVPWNAADGAVFTLERMPAA